MYSVKRRGIFYSFEADNHVTNSSYIEMILCMCNTVNDGEILHYIMMQQLIYKIICVGLIQ